MSDVRVPWLPGYHDQSKVDLHEGKGPENEKDGAVAMPGRDGELSVSLQTGKETAKTPAGDLSEQAEQSDPSDGLLVPEH